jgi:hypothetical protein
MSSELGVVFEQVLISEMHMRTFYKGPICNVGFTAESVYIYN